MGALLVFYLDTPLTGNQRRHVISNVQFRYATADDGNVNATVNYAPQRINNAQFDGWRVTSGPWEFRLGKPLAGALNGIDGVLALGRRGSWFGLHLHRFAWFDQATRDVTPIGAGASYNRSNLSRETATLEGIAVQTVATWSGIFPGVELKIYAEGKQLKTEIRASQAARNAANAVAPAGNPYLVGLFQVDLINVPKALKQGAQQSLTDFDDDAQHGIEWQNATNALIGYMPVDRAWVENADGTRAGDGGEVVLRKRFFTSGGQLWLAVGIAKSVLDTMPAGTLVLDPTLSLQPDETAALDTYLQADTPTTNYGTSGVIQVRRPSSSSSRTLLIKFDLSSIPVGSTIDSATLYFTGNDSSDPVTVDFYRSRRAWVESEATWNIWSTGNNWGTAGALSTSTDYYNTSMGTMVLGSTPNTEHSVSLNTTEFAALVAQNDGIMVIAQEGTISITKTIRSSSDNTGSPAGIRRPRIEVVYTLASGGLPWLPRPRRRMRQLLVR